MGSKELDFYIGDSVVVKGPIFTENGNEIHTNEALIVTSFSEDGNVVYLRPYFSQEKYHASVNNAFIDSDWWYHRDVLTPEEHRLAKIR